MLTLHGIPQLSPAFDKCWLLPGRVVAKAGETISKVSCMLPKTEEEFSNCCFQNWTGFHTVFHFTKIACSVLLKLDQKLGTPRKQIPKSSQEQQPRDAFVCQLGWLGIQEYPWGSSNPPWTVFSLEQGFSCPCWEGQSAQGHRLEPHPDCQHTCIAQTFLQLWLSLPWEM